MHPRGFGFVRPDVSGSYTEDIFIPKQRTRTAVNGDVVEVSVSRTVSEKGPEGAVISIIKRKNSQITGTILKSLSQNSAIAYVPVLGSHRRVLVSSKHVLNEDDRIIMDVIDWGEDSNETLCQFSRSFGSIMDASCDIDVAIEEFSIREKFPESVLEEVERLSSRVTSRELKGREDLRGLECVTIDPDTAKDFDDALSLEHDSNGHLHLGVHIADVAHYIEEGSALDQEARKRCNSTYFPGRCIPMLPPKLSENLCSLRPNVNRLTVSVLVEFDSDANIINYRIVRSVIHSKKRFTYREAKDILDNKKKSSHKDLLMNLVTLCKAFKKKRYERGSIEFSLPEVRVILDSDGDPQKLESIEYDITHQLVEECMLKANEIIATHLNKTGKNLAYRIHDEPKEIQLENFATLVQAYGFHIPSHPSPADLQKLFDIASQTPHSRQLSIFFIRSLPLAYYSSDNIGHYGLCLEYYCHFTSPIRRYSDLLVQRIIFDDALRISKKDIQSIAEDCSDHERVSARAESSVTLQKKFRFINKELKTSPNKKYNATITRVNEKGIVFEITDYMIEGFLHVSELKDDYYLFDSKDVSLAGRRHGKRHSCGDTLSVTLLSIDLITLESRWRLVI